MQGWNKGVTTHCRTSVVPCTTQKHVRRSRRPGHKRPRADPAQPPPPAWVTSPHPMTRTLTSRVEVAPGQPINTFSLPLASEPLFIRHPRASNKLVVVTGLYIFTTHQFLGRCKTPLHPTEPRGGQYNVSNIPPPQRDSTTREILYVPCFSTRVLATPFLQYPSCTTIVRQGKSWLKRCQIFFVCTLFFRAIATRRARYRTWT